MESFIEAVKNNDLVSAKKAFGELMSEKKNALIEEEKIVIAKSIVIEGEEKSEKDDPEDDEDDDKEDKEKGKDENKEDK